MTSPSTPGGKKTTTPPGVPPPGTPAPAPADLHGIEQAITALTTFLRNGRATADQRPFTPEQLETEDDFRALVHGLGRPRPEDLPGRFEWSLLATDRLELTAPLPAGMTRIGGYTADRVEVWLIDVSPSGDRTVFTHSSITPERVVRLRAFDATGRERLVGFPARSAAPSTPPVVR